MPLSPNEFREALSYFASGVTVVTTRNATGQSLGLTASAFTSVGEVESARVQSGEPLLYYRGRYHSL